MLDKKMKKVYYMYNNYNYKGMTAVFLLLEGN